MSRYGNKTKKTIKQAVKLISNGITTLLDHAQNALSFQIYTIAFVVKKLLGIRAAQIISLLIHATLLYFTFQPFVILNALLTLADTAPKLLLLIYFSNIFVQMALFPLASFIHSFSLVTRRLGLPNYMDVDSDVRKIW